MNMHYKAQNVNTPHNIFVGVDRKIFGNMLTQRSFYA